MDSAVVEVIKKGEDSFRTCYSFPVILQGEALKEAIYFVRRREQDECDKRNREKPGRFDLMDDYLVILPGDKVAYWEKSNEVENEVC